MTNLAYARNALYFLAINWAKDLPPSRKRRFLFLRFLIIKDPSEVRSKAGRYVKNKVRVRSVIKAAAFSVLMAKLRDGVRARTRNVLRVENYEGRRFNK